MVILIKNLPNDSLINELKVKRRLSKVLKALGKDRHTLTVLVTGDEEIRDLNRTYRKIDKTTNVLAFPFRGPSGEFEGPPSPPLPAPWTDFLGDIAVSFETIGREAKENGLDHGELFYFYLIHGILHLVGYDHTRGEAEAKAHDAETTRLMALIPHTLE